MDYVIPGEIYDDEIVARRRARELRHEHPHVWLEEHECDPAHKDSKTLRAIIPNPDLAFHMDVEDVDDAYEIMCAYYKKQAL